MKKIYSFQVVIALLLFASCNTAKKTVTSENGKIDITIVQINDVYEIAPLDGGKVGGNCPPIETEHGWLMNYHAVIDFRKRLLKLNFSQNGSGMKSKAYI